MLLDMVLPIPFEWMGYKIEQLVMSRKKVTQDDDEDNDNVNMKLIALDYTDKGHDTNTPQHVLLGVGLWNDASSFAGPRGVWFPDTVATCCCPCCHSSTKPCNP